METIKCNACGNVIGAGEKFCSECGAKVPEKVENNFTPEQPIDKKEETVVFDAQPKVVYHNPAPAAPAYQAAPAYKPAAPASSTSSADSNEEPEGKYALITPWGWVGINFLMAIPFVNILLLFIWACGGARKQQKRNFARGFWLTIFVEVLIVVVAVIVAIIVFAVMGISINEILNSTY